MKLWPFGSDDDPPAVDSVSRVVSATANDGAAVRAKLTIHFEGEVPQTEADEQIEVYSARLRQRFEEAETGQELLGSEANLSAELGGRRASATAAIRSVEVVALHLVGSTSVPPPVSKRSYPPPAMAQGRSRGSSSQMLAVRGDILVQAGATPETAGLALAPLLRDVKTRVLIGILRNYDLVALRRVEVDEEMLDAMVPQSTAALGRFAESRAEELERWTAALGEATLAALRVESAAITSLYFERALTQQSVDPEVARGVLDHAAKLAFTAGLPSSRIAHYAAVTSDQIAMELAKALSSTLAELDDPKPLARAMVPVLHSLDADFVFAAAQVKLSVSP